jgi:hypothetical protein
LFSQQWPIAPQLPLGWQIKISNKRPGTLRKAFKKEPKATDPQLWQSRLVHPKAFYVGQSVPSFQYQSIALPEITKTTILLQKYMCLLKT